MRVISLFFLFLLSSCIASAQCTPVPNQTPATLSCVAESPLVTGGSGTDRGKWFEITSAAVPDGYSIVSVSFRLEGPHPCNADISYPKDQAPVASTGSVDQIVHSVTGIAGGAIAGSMTISKGRGVGSWAECEEVKLTKSSATWHFRFQGWTAEDRTIAIEKNSDADPSCKQKDKPQEKEDYCNQTSVHFGWTNHDEAIRQKAKLLTIAVQQ